ncbi:MAG: UPF0262 family protein [Alphaproteobacteria bacterium]
MTDKIVKLSLDERTIVRRSPEIEHERSVALFDLLEENHFAPHGLSYAGPYDVQLSLTENRLIFSIRDEAEKLQGEIILPLSPFRRIVRDYFLICESYYEAIKTAVPAQIEAIDMGRRALHDEGSQLLRELLEAKITIDFPTSRRLFTLLCVLHIRG